MAELFAIDEISIKKCLPALFYSLLGFLIHFYISILGLGLICLYAFLLYLKKWNRNLPLIVISCVIGILYVFNDEIVRLVTLLSPYLGGINFTQYHTEFMGTYTYLTGPAFLVFPAAIVYFVKERENLKINIFIGYFLLLFAALMLVRFGDFVRVLVFIQLFAYVIIGFMLPKLAKVVEYLLIKYKREKYLKITQIAVIGMIIFSLIVPSTYYWMMKNKVLPYYWKTSSSLGETYYYHEYEVAQFFANTYKGESRVLLISDGATAEAVGSLGSVSGWVAPPNSPEVNEFRTIINQTYFNVSINYYEFRAFFNRTVDLQNFEKVYFLLTPRTVNMIKGGYFHLSIAIQPDSVENFTRVVSALSRTPNFNLVLEYEYCKLYEINMWAA
jgi:hypothetical protein